MPLMVFTSHAVDRFIERHAPEMSCDEALEHLDRAAQQAVRLNAKTLLGQEQWEMTEPRCILVTKHDQRQGIHVCVTVLPSPERFGPSEDELELMREAAASLPPLLKLEPVPESPPPKLKKISPPPPRKEPKASPPAILAKREEASRTHALVVAAGMVRQQEKTARHRLTVERDVDRYKEAIRLAVRFLVSLAAEKDPDAPLVLAQIQSVDPYFVTEGFIQERRR